MLEHVDRHDVALKNMIAAARAVCYFLAPYAEDVQNCDVDKRLHAYRTADHVVCGFDRKYFESIGGYARLTVQGAYWHEFGRMFWEMAAKGADAEAERQALAQGDLLQRPPSKARPSP